MQSIEESWKITFPCTRIEAENLSEDSELLAEMPFPPVLMTREIEEDDAEHWLLEAYFEHKPDTSMIQAVRALVPSAKDATAQVEHIAGEDWVTLSQSGLEPVQAGRFYVHTAAHAHSIPPDAVAFSIEAGQAFGTGQHETTTGCLLMLDRLKRTGSRFSNVADVGTGTGLLAFAAFRLWPAARVIASDIDPVAIAVCHENANANAIALGAQRGSVELVVAAGLAHRRLRRRAPYDLIIANILAGPLIELAPVLAGAIKPGGSVILAGLLDSQAEAVTAAYRLRGMRLAHRIDQGSWPTLRLEKRKRFARIKRPG
jgi:ribosomal protein L11 methyltransferase